MAGIILIAVGYIKTNQECPPNLVEFRYVPRTFEQDQDLPQPIMSLYGNMFNNQSPWFRTDSYDNKINN